MSTLPVVAGPGLLFGLAVAGYVVHRIGWRRHRRLGGIVGRAFGLHEVLAGLVLVGLAVVLIGSAVAGLRASAVLSLLALIGLDIAWRTRKRWRGRVWSGVKAHRPAMPAVGMPTFSRDRRKPIADGNRIIVGQNVLGRPIYTPARQARSVLVVGPAQSGKTSSVIVGNVLHWVGPVVSTSTKNDVLLATFEDRSKQGDVWVVDFAAQPSPVPAGVKALHWTPIRGCEDFQRALIRANAMTSVVGTGDGASGFFNSRAMELLAPLFCAAARGGHKLSDVLGWLRSGNYEEPMAVLDSSPELSDARSMLQQIEHTHDRQRNDIEATALASLKAYRGRRLTEADNPSDDYDPRRLLTESGSLFAIVPPTESEYAAPACAAIIEEVYDAARALSEERGGPLEPKLLLALDELANTAPVPVDMFMSEAAGRGVLCLPAVQSFAQLEHRYGKRSQVILDNARSTVVFAGLKDVPFLQSLAALAGSRFDAKRGQVPHLTVDELTSIPFGSAYVFGNRQGKGKRVFQRVRWAPPRARR